MKRLVRRVRRARETLRAPPPDVVRYFIVSPYKTATTTVGSALITLGAGQREMKFRRGALSDHRKAIRKLNASIAPDIGAAAWIATHGDSARAVLAPIIPMIRRHDVFSDAPFGHGHIHCFALRAIEPRARFIWVDRPLYDWLDSVREWEMSHPETYPRHGEWIENPSYRRRRLRRKRDQLYDDFSRMAQDFPQDCLELTLEDLQSWDKLAAFCGRPALPGAPMMRNVRRARPPSDED